MKTLIKNGTVVTSAEMVVADVLIDGERIAAVGSGLGDADTVIDATDRLVMPGGIDVHTHMELPFGGTFASDDFATGTRAAAFGGTTTIVDFAVQGFGETLSQGLDNWLEKAEPKSHIDFGLHLIVREISEGILKEMDAMIERGVPSFKLFMAYPGVFMLDDASIFRAMSRTADNGGLIMLHAENGGAIDVLVQRYLAEGKTAPINHGLTRPSSMEGEATHRAIALAELAEVPVYIVHLSAREALDAVREGRDRGVHAYAETCPQYLYLTMEDMARPGFEGAKYVCSPPLRPREHQAELWKGLVLDDLQVVSTDHCPFDYKDQKILGANDFSAIPNGLPGVEDRYTLLWDGGVATGQITPMRFVELIATAPARMFGLHPKKGTLSPGADADVVVFDPAKRRVLSASTHHMRVDYSCYEGREVTGSPEVVLQRGRVLVEHGEFHGKPGDGKFLARSAFSSPGIA
ncbi:MAG TPA: dihydropyrimidinase [Acidimicrobiales bacterium]|jgi:dihydropyrimidinase|nr:dihydropyrimidinase [Acidimicrobiales bacterium]